MANGQIRSRIVGHEDVAPDQLLAHDSNFRRHPGRQLDALRGSLRELGWVKTILVSKRSGRVIDGHARVEEALRQNLASVPVTYLDLSPEEERKALAVLDPITEMAFRDDDALASLLAEVTTEDPGLQALLDDLAGKEAPSDGDPDAANEPQDQDVAALIVDCASLEQRDRLAARLSAEGFSCRRTVLKPGK